MSELDEGYIKFRLNWEKSSAPDQDLSELIHYRDEVYRKGWIGFDSKHQVGYGNISVRLNQADQFIISATQTGHISATLPEHYCEVYQCDVERNTVWCRGPLAASSESMSHAAVYSCSPDIKAIIHIHNKRLWEKTLHQIPTTSAEVAYGTPEMAWEIQRLYRETTLPEQAILAMAGHEDGLIAFGKNLEQALNRLTHLSGNLP